MATLETLQPIGRAVFDEQGAAAVRASPADSAVGLYNGDSLTVIEQSLQRACKLLALVVRQLGQAVDQARHLLLSHGLLLGQTQERRTQKMRTRGRH